MISVSKIVFDFNRLAIILVIAFIGCFLNFAKPEKLYAQKNLEELKEQVLASPYVFSSILSAKKLPMGESVTLSNSVKRRGFAVAGKPVLILFDPPQPVVKMAGLFVDENLNILNAEKDSKTDILPEPVVTNLYRLLTDPAGNAVVSFLPRETGTVSVEVYFLNVPNDYVEHAEQKTLQVFSLSRLKATFWLIPGFLGGLFVMVLLIRVLQILTKAKFSSLQSRSSINDLNILFPWMGLLIEIYNRFVLKINSVPLESEDTGRKFLQNSLSRYATQVMLIFISILIAIIIYTSYTLMMGMLFSLLLLMWFFSTGESDEQPTATKISWVNGLRVQVSSGFLILVLLWGFDFLFIREYSTLEVFPEYLSPNNLVWLTGLVLVVLAPSVWVGCWVLLVMWQGSGDVEVVFHFLGTYLLDTVSLVIPEAQFWINQTGTKDVDRSQLNFLTKQFFYMALLSVMISAFVTMLEIAITRGYVFNIFTTEKKSDKSES